MNAPFPTSAVPFTDRSATGAVRCPLREGPLTLDSLLADLGRDLAEAETLDLALDLRFAFFVARDADACGELVQRLRRALGERHYLAHYRVRLWLSRSLALEIRAHRAEAWSRQAFPLSSTPIGSVEHIGLKSRVQYRGSHDASFAQIRYVFTASSDLADAV